MNSELKKLTERNFIYTAAPKCPFCGGYMLPLSYLADPYGSKCSGAWLYNKVPGELKACGNCGIVRFYPDKES